MKFLAILILIIFLGGCKNEINTPEVKQQQPYREFTKSIERIFSNEYEKSLISLAEKLYPPRDSVLSAANLDFQPYIPDTAYWFFEAFDGVAIPYCITIEAVDYYSGIIDTLNAISNSIIYKAQFNYKAEVSHFESYIFEGIDQFTGLPLPSVPFADVYVVEMNLSWDHYCGEVCGLYIDHKRVVVFSSAGIVLQVFYDGKIPIMVS